MQQKIPADRFNVDGFYHPHGTNKGTVSLLTPETLRIQFLFNSKAIIVSALASPVCCLRSKSEPVSLFGLLALPLVRALEWQPQEEDREKHSSRRKS